MAWCVQLVTKHICKLQLYACPLWHGLWCSIECGTTFSNRLCSYWHIPQISYFAHTYTRAQLGCDVTQDYFQQWQRCRTTPEEVWGVCSLPAPQCESRRQIFFGVTSWGWRKGRIHHTCVYCKWVTQDSSGWCVDVEYLINGYGWFGALLVPLWDKNIWLCYGIRLKGL